MFRVAASTARGPVIRPPIVLDDAADNFRDLGAVVKATYLAIMACKPLCHRLRPCRSNCSCEEAWPVGETAGPILADW